MNDFNLNDNQKIAVKHNEGPMLVLAGPGSGKTTVIMYRIKNLIEFYNVEPKNILVITFAKSTAEEMKNRFLSMFNYKESNVFFGTFHAVFFKIIRRIYNYTLDNILNENEKINIIKKIVYDLKITFENEEEFLQNISSEISLIKNELINLDFYEPINIAKYDFFEIFNKYENIKIKMNKIDFDDMLVKCYEVLKSDNNICEFWKNQYKYILIDEFQDINKVQYECIKLLTNKKSNIFIVGDDDQSIYKFRGSRPEFLFSFPKDFYDCKKVVLNINYRSTEQIINLCNEIIKQNSNRYIKNIIGTGKTYKTPLVVRPFDTTEEAIFIAKKIQIFQKNFDLEKIAIIYRTNMQARAIVDALMDYNIAYQFKDKIFNIYEHWIVKDIKAYLTLAINKKENDSFLRIINKPKRYFSKLLINDLKEKCDKSVSMIDFLYSMREIKSWQLEKLHELSFHLKQLQNKNTYDAIKYILKTINYQDYLHEYASFKKIKSKGLIEIADEILVSSKGHESILDYIEHIENMAIEIKNNTRKKKEDLFGVVLSTMHSSKGLEFDVVFVIGCIESVIPHEKSKLYEDIEEERRLFYVGLTRAKKILYLSIPKTKYEDNVEPSRFLKNLIKL